MQNPKDIQNAYLDKRIEYMVIGHRICPYVQRAIILLKEKDIDYKKYDIDLDSKPEWLSDISPTMKVPVLIVRGESTIFESTVICDYLSEVDNNSFYRRGILQKAIDQSWIVYSSSILDLIAKMIYADKSKDELGITINSIKEKLNLVNQIVNFKPYFHGNDFTMIDVMYAPVFRYLVVFSNMLDVNFYSSFDRLKIWGDSVLNRPSVINCVPIDYTEMLKKFINDRGSYLSTLIA